MDAVSETIVVTTINCADKSGPRNAPVTPVEVSRGEFGHG
jgi:hypothetical protein